MVVVHCFFFVIIIISINNKNIQEIKLFVTPDLLIFVIFCHQNKPVHRPLSTEI